MLITIIILITVILLFIIGIGSGLENKETTIDPIYSKLKSERDRLVQELDRINNELQENGVTELDNRLMHIKLMIMKIDFLLDTYIK